MPSVEEISYSAQVLLQGCFDGLKGVVLSPKCGVICIRILHAIPLWHIRHVDVEQCRGENRALWYAIAKSSLPATFAV